MVVVSRLYGPGAGDVDLLANHLHLLLEQRQRVLDDALLLALAALARRVLARLAHVAVCCRCLMLSADCRDQHVTDRRKRRRHRERDDDQDHPSHTMLARRPVLSRPEEAAAPLRSKL